MSIIIIIAAAAFDSLPHTCIVTVMEINQLCSMKKWKTEMWLYTPKGMSKQGKWLLNGEYSKVTACLHYWSV
jgi:hypothetical protein